MKFTKINAELGQCYFNGFAFIIANAQFADSHLLRYVQGVVTGTTDGHRIGHCWVELTDPETGQEYVLEPVPHGLVPKNKYYARVSATNVHRYEIDRMIGVWEDKGFWGAWTDDVRDALHTGGVPAPEQDRELIQKARALGLPAIEVD